MDGTFLLDGKHRGVHYKKMLFSSNTTILEKNLKTLLIELKEDRNFKKKNYFLKISKTNTLSI